MRIEDSTPAKDGSEVIKMLEDGGGKPARNWTTVNRKIIGQLSETLAQQ